jgi:hypothetical protein
MLLYNQLSKIPDLSRAVSYEGPLEKVPFLKIPSYARALTEKSGLYYESILEW